MNIDNANVNELKSYIHSQMVRCAAIAQFFWLFNSESAEDFTGYVRDMAELVETSRLSQEALAKLIEIEGANVNEFLLNDCVIRKYQERFDDHPLETLICSFMCMLHCCGAEAQVFADEFKRNSQMGFVVYEGVDHSELYARSCKSLVDIHETTLAVQVVFSHILRISNRDKFEFRYL